MMKTIFFAEYDAALVRGVSDRNTAKAVCMLESKMSKAKILATQLFFTHSFTGPESSVKDSSERISDRRGDGDLNVRKKNMTTI